MVQPSAGFGIRVMVTGGPASFRANLKSLLLDLGAIPTDQRVDVVMVLQPDGPPTIHCALRRLFESTPIIFVAHTGSEQLVVAAFRAGANDYLTWPVTPSALAESLRRVCPGARADHTAPLLLGESGAMVRLRAVIPRIAAKPCNVLITGETGTGKDVVARLLHRSSPRSGRPFVTINCSALPETLVESELFGYERGAFTGAQAGSIGRLQAGDGGTIFLDEVGELSLAMQPKLLRAIDQREVQRLGSQRHETIDVRWVAATNRDLQRSVGTGLFRADLYYRLNVHSLVIPPLRERSEDILVLAEAFLSNLAPVYGRPGVRFTGDALARLVAHDWPGNVRELHNVVESSLLCTEAGDIGLDALPTALGPPPPTLRYQPAGERVRVVEALRAAGGNKSDAAHRLNWSRMTLYRKLVRHRIDVTAECHTGTTKPGRE